MVLQQKFLLLAFLCVSTFFTFTSILLFSYYNSIRILLMESKFSTHHRGLNNIPQIYFDTNETSKQINNTCARFPQLLDLRFSVDPWQVQTTSLGTFHLFSAYLDERNGLRTIRILGLYNRLKPNQTLFCQNWIKEAQQPIITEANLFLLWLTPWGGRDGMYFSYIISCAGPKMFIPISVSVVEKICDNATNNLKVNYKKVEEEEKKNFVVCVKGLNFPFEDNSVRLIEWMELIFILGAEKITFYEFEVHPSTARVLDYYQTQGKIEVVPITLIGGISNNPYIQSKFLHEKVIERRLQEVLPYNDCLYKHLAEFKFIVLLDLDEVIMPSNRTWTELIQHLQTKSKRQHTSFMARNVYFFDSYVEEHGLFEDIPTNMHMLQHVYRSHSYSPLIEHTKGFHDTRRVLGLHNHFPFVCLGRCATACIDPHIAHLQHYKSNCDKEMTEICASMKQHNTLDTRIWHFKEALIGRVERTMKVLDIFSN